MTEILTESFCERCGTRYTFEAAIPKKRRIGKLKVLSKGLKNYVLSDDASLDEALAEARSDEQREVSGGQLDAFHQTFQFCMACRQYTCSNCWNEAEGRCLSCAPLSTGAGPLRSPLDDLLAGGGMAPLVSQHFDPDAAQPANGNGHASLHEPAPTVVGSAWPTIDLFRTTRAEPIGEPPEPLAEPIVEGQPEAVVEPQPPAAVESRAGDPAAAAPGDGLPANFWTQPFTGYAPIPEPAASAEPSVDARADELAARTTRLLGRFRVQAPIGESGPKARPAPVAEVVPEPPAEAGWISVAPPEPEPPEPAEPAAEPLLPQPKPGEAGADRIERPLWAIAQRPSTNGQPLVAPPASQSPAIQPAPGPSVQVQAVVAPARSPGEAPQWPAPLRPGVDLSIPAFWASGDVTPGTRDAGLWTASAQEVAGMTGQTAVQGGIQSCVSCGLSLSATARFCRRCGSRQS
jgi:ribosomal protein L40E